MPSRLLPSTNETASMSIVLSVAPRRGTEVVSASGLTGTPLPGIFPNHPGERETSMLSNKTCQDPVINRSCKIEHNRKAAEASFSWPAAHSSPRTANAHQRASDRADDEAWVDCLDGQRSWISWARAVAQQDPEKIARIKAVTSMLAGLKRSEEGSLGRHPPR